MISAGDWHHLEWFDQFVFLCCFVCVLSPWSEGGLPVLEFTESVLSSVWVLSADLMSFLWSSSFQIHWKTWFLLEGDKKQQNGQQKNPTTSITQKQSISKEICLALRNSRDLTENAIPVKNWLFTNWCSTGSAVILSKEQIKFCIIRFLLW